MTDAPPLPRIVQVEVLDDHELRLTFDDGLVGETSRSGTTNGVASSHRFETLPGLPRSP